MRLCGGASSFAASRRISNAHDSAPRREARAEAKPRPVPQILNHDELVRLFTVTTNLKHRALLMTAYAAGLRASELGRLQLTDVDSARMCLRVDQGKGNKDRYVPLSPRLLEQLREYRRRDRPKHWLFPSRPLDRPMSRSGPAHIYQAAKDKARIRKTGGIHSLRHAYAIHVHCIVTDGALSPDRERWLTPPRRGFLFPTAALSKVFRGKYLDFLTTAHRHGELRISRADGLDDTRAFGCLRTSLQSHDWIVYTKAPFASAATCRRSVWFHPSLFLSLMVPATVATGSS